MHKQVFGLAFQVRLQKTLSMEASVHSETPCLADVS